MTYLEQAFMTTAGTTFKHVVDKNGVDRYFKDGTPIKIQSFNGGKAHIPHPREDYMGQKVKIAVPSDKGPGYERLEVMPREASDLGKELNEYKRGTAKERVKLAGEMYDIEVIATMNERLANLDSPADLFRYT